MSVLARLQNEAKRTGETFNAVLGRYVGFRLLYRLTKSRFTDQFLLKGATMFLFWIGAMHRPTADFDLLGMTADPDELKRLFVEIAEPESVEIPGMIRDVPTASMPCYTVETSFAEKLEAMARFGLANSRMKDFLDLATLIQQAEIDLGLLRQAILATFQRRKTDFPKELPVALTEEFWTDQAVMRRWRAFTRKNMVQPPFDDLQAVCTLIAAKVEPLLR